MKIPSSDLYISPQKLSNYLLNVHHPDGGSKAKLLLGFGFDANSVSTLKNAIIKLLKSNELSKEIITEYGVKYLIEGTIETPSGRVLKIRTVWVKELNEEIVKFVTLYPI